MSRARVLVSTGYLSDAELAEAHLEQTHDVAQTVTEAGTQATMCALPDGPMTVPYVVWPGPRRPDRHRPEIGPKSSNTVPTATSPLSRGGVGAARPRTVTLPAS
jgi:hypothetical protein